MKKLGKNNLPILRWRVATLISFCLLSGCSEPKNSNNTLKSKGHAWADELVAAYEALDSSRNTHAANLLFKATANMPRRNWENYLVCATIYAPNGQNDKAFQAIDEAIATGLRDTALLNTIPELSILKSDTRWKKVISDTQKMFERELSKIQNPGVLKLLKKLWAANQVALSEYEQNIALLDSTATDEDYRLLFMPVEERWDLNKEHLDSIITLHGWPGNRLVGEDGAKISWAIPQHHPDVFFKQKCLSLMREALQKGDLDPNHFAELSDRISRELWQKQTYGASMGQDAPYPIENASEVNQRRFDLGLMEPVEVYAYYHGVSYTPPTKEEEILNEKVRFKEAQKHYSQFEQFIKTKEVDSALFHLREGIKSFGNLSNEQFFKASLTLAAHPEQQCKRLGHKIVKVLIWRKWEKRFENITKANYTGFNQNQWNTIASLLQKSH